MSSDEMTLWERIVASTLSLLGIVWIYGKYFKGKPVVYRAHAVPEEAGQSTQESVSEKIQEVRETVSEEIQEKTETLIEEAKENSKDVKSAAKALEDSQL